MLNLRQVSAFDYPSLIGSADLSIDLSPEEIARRFGLVTERSFDDLGVYEFLAVEIDHGIIAFRRYTEKTDPYSYVSYSGISREAAQDLVRKLLPKDQLNMLCTDDRW